MSGGAKGVFLADRSDRPVVTFADGSSGVVLEGAINHPIRFFVHPSFAGFRTREYYVRVTVRRVAPGNVGMNLLYEVADSQGRNPYANTGGNDNPAPLSVQNIFDFLTAWFSGGC